MLVYLFNFWLLLLFYCWWYRTIIVMLNRNCLCHYTDYKQQIFNSSSIGQSLASLSQICLNECCSHSHQSHLTFDYGTFLFFPTKKRANFFGCGNAKQINLTVNLYFIFGWFKTKFDPILWEDFVGESTVKKQKNFVAFA